MKFRQRIRSLTSKALRLKGHAQRKQFLSLRRNYYFDFWQCAARRVNARFEDLGEEYYRLTRNNRSTIIRRGDVMLDSTVVYDLAGNKPLTYKLYAEIGVPAPPHVVFDANTPDEAVAFLKSCSGPIVIKPATDTGGGQGVTTGISTQQDLCIAVRRATNFSPMLLGEEQIAGDNYRLLYLNGQLLDIVKRMPPVLTGDGTSTIRELVKSENEKRLNEKPVSALSPLALDKDAELTLNVQGLSPASIPQSGQKFIVKKVVNQNACSQNLAIDNDFHPSTLAQIDKLIQHLNIELAGVDVICKERSEPLEHGNGFIMEVNTCPGLHHHYLTSSSGAPNYVADKLINYLLERASSFGSSS